MIPAHRLGFPTSLKKGRLVLRSLDAMPVNYEAEGQLMQKLIPGDGVE